MPDRLRFGTSGLRAPLGDGPDRMNALTVQLAATAFAQWLPDDSTVVIGRDARHGSAQFADVTARVLSGAGHRVRMFAEPVPTPVVAHEIGRTDASGGVVVTASHNPASDNGYKVYVADGGQLLPEDAAAIEAIMDGLEWPEPSLGVETSADPNALELLGAPEIDAYLGTIRAETKAGPDTARSSQVIVYSAMHGVGGELAIRALEAAGHVVHPVPEQHTPDPDFPTAPFPNPEEPGTLDLAIAQAVEVGADLVLANDPDGDRLAVAVPRKGEGIETGSVGYERLTGDEIGVLLGDYVMSRSARPGCVATTVVSSTLLDKVAGAQGFECHRTLTGFKWLARSGSDGVPLCFAYEEALGYSVAPTIRDKDGISAALSFADMAAVASARGRSVDDLLSDVYGQHGFHLTSQVALRFEGDDPMAEMNELMSRLRDNPPASLAGVPVTEVEDFGVGDPNRPVADLVILHLANGRLAIRPSGTEPKLKSYIEVINPDRAIAATRLADLETAARVLLGAGA